MRYEAGIDGHRERKSTTVGEITSFVWPINMWIHDMNAVAFNKDGEALFGYGFLENDNYINIEKDLRWHRIEK